MRDIHGELMRRLAILLTLLALALPAEAATRFYFTVADASPLPSLAIDAGWEDTTVERRRLAHVKGSDAITVGQVVNITEGQANWQAVDRQYTSASMNAGVVFSSGTTSVRAVLMVREYTIADNVDKCIVGIRILSENGLTVRATLFDVSDRGLGGEFINNASHRNKQCADGDLVTANYTTVAGDRLVVEIGYQTTSIDNTPQASAKWGQSATDCAENQTNTTDCAGWIEFSNTITFPGTSRRVMVIP